MTTQTVKRSFEIGWNYGRLYGYALSRREAAEYYPDCDPDALIEGSIDGMNNDTWRLEGGQS